jgi:hypothetical protein
LIGGRFSVKLKVEISINKVLFSTIHFLTNQILPMSDTTKLEPCLNFFLIFFKAKEHGSSTDKYSWSQTLTGILKIFQTFFNRCHCHHCSSIWNKV